MPLGKGRRTHQRTREPDEESPTTNTESPITTVMVRNIPTRYTSLGLIEVLKDHGFEKTFDFLYLPVCNRLLISLFMHLDGFSNAKECWICLSQLY